MLRPKRPLTLSGRSRPAIVLRVLRPQGLPERKTAPVGLRQRFEPVVVVGAREKNRRHLLAAAVPEPEAPGRWRVSARLDAVCAEEGGPADPSDRGEVGRRL